MWTITITYKVATSLTTLGTKDAVFSIMVADGERDAFDQAEAEFRMDEATVNANIVDIKSEYDFEEVEIVTNEYLVTVGYTLEVNFQVVDRQQVFNWKETQSYGSAVQKAEVIFRGMNPSATINGIKVEKVLR